MPDRPHPRGTGAALPVVPADPAAGGGTLWSDPASGLRVIVDAARDTLRVVLVGASATDGHATTATTHPATLDVGEGGRLIGVEVDGPGPDGGADGWYLPLEPASGDQTRSVAVTVTVGRGTGGAPAWLDLPRRGPGYELTFPSGNRCWVRPRRAG